MADSRVLLVSSRLTAVPCFAGLARHRTPAAAWPFAVTRLPADTVALARPGGGVEGAAVAVVDVSPPTEVAPRECWAHSARRAGLPLRALPAGRHQRRPAERR